MSAPARLLKAATIVCAAVILFSITLFDGPARGMSVTQADWSIIDEARPPVIKSEKVRTRGLHSQGGGFQDLGISLRLYDQTGRILREQLVGERVEIVTWRYDEFGRPIIVQHGFAEGGAADVPAGTLKSVFFEYEGDSLNPHRERREHYHAADTWHSLKYDGEGRLVERTTTTLDQPAETLESCAWSTGERGDSVLTRNIHAGDGDTIHVETYGAAGLLLSELITTPGEEGGELFEYGYEYDNRGNWTKRIVSRTLTPGGEREPWQMSEREIVYW